MAQKSKLTKVCTTCDGTGEVYIPHKDPKLIGNHYEMGSYIPCTKCKNGCNPTLSSKERKTK